MTLSSMAAWADSEPIVLVAPPDYQVLSLSPNGKWATGIYSDYSSTQRGFLWNLESNNIDLLSTGDESQGWSVADNGTVCGAFTDYSTSDIGAGTLMPGYYRDGEWHSVEVPQGFSGPSDNYHGAGQGYGISADGTVMTGSLYVNGNYSPCVWNEGHLVELLDISNDGMQGGAPYCISPDGKMVGGWSYRYNRSCTIWNLTSGTRTFISDEQSPWASVNRFSPDGRKVLYGGGWDMSIPQEDNTQYYYSIYDVETGEATSLPSLNHDATVSLFGISNSYTCVGSTGDYDGGRAIIYPNGHGPGVLMEDYFVERGVDFSDLHLLVPEELGYMMLFRGQDISADDNVFAILGRDMEGLRSIIVMLNQDSEHAAPIEVKARQLSGITTSELSWKTPIRSTEGLVGYRIYRDGTLLAEVPATQHAYYDRSLVYGNYVYGVASLYSDGTEMLTSAPSLGIQPQAVARPEEFTARQKGVYSIVSEWKAPGTNLVNKSWYTPSTANLRGFGIALDAQTIELGVGFLQQEMENYEGYSISKVNFYPMSEQGGWRLNVYQYDGVTPVRIYSQEITQELVYKQRNTVILDQPVPVPTQGDVVVAFEVDVPVASMGVLGMDYGHNYPGFSDLIRLSSEPDFYSYYYTSAAYGYPEYAAFMIDVVLTAEGQDLSADEVAGYRLTLDGQEVLASTTEMNWKSGKVASGAHTLGVQAIFADGKVSDPVNTTVDIAYNYKMIEEVNIDHQGTTEVTFSWEAPIDDDFTEVTFALGQPQNQGLVGPAENNYGIMARVDYDQTKFVGYDGYQITSLNFYPLADATFTFMLFSEDEQLRELPVYDYQLYTWNTIQLDEPITIQANTSYALVLDCYDVEPHQPALAIDNRLPLAFTSDLFSLDGVSWSSITVESGLSGNWMMGLNIIDPNAGPVAVDGYDVSLDNKMIGTKVTETSLTYDLESKIAGQHNLRVNTYYTGRATSVKGSLITFYIDPAGIHRPLAETYRLTRGTDVLGIEGGDVTSIAVIAADGKVVARAQGNKVGVASLPAGVYMVKAAAAGKDLSYKIVID